MTREAQAHEVLKLLHADGAEAAPELLASFDEEPAGSSEEVEKAWAEEIERRARRVLAGESVGIPWEQVRRRIERRLAK